MSKKQIIIKALSAFKPKPQLTISQWADEYRHIARGTGPEPGKWKTSRSPYLKEIMDAFNSSAGMVVVMASSQIGKTEIGLNVMGYYMEQDPAPIMYLLPTDDLAGDFSKTRIDPTIRQSPVLKKLFSYSSRDSDNTISLKAFAGGYITIHGASTPTKLSSKPIRVLIADEVDRYPPTVSDEGEPLKLAIQRTTNFWNRKILIISTPTVKETSVIVSWFERSDKRYYNVPCPHCKAEMVLTWELMKWDNDANGVFIPESAHIECPACAGKIKDAHKEAMLLAGRWVINAPDKTIPGFHISSLYSPWVDFKDLVAEYIEIADLEDNSKMREFLNLKLGEPYEAVIEDLDMEMLANHKIAYGAELADGVLYLTCGVDVQDNRLEYQILGFGEDNQIWVITNQIIPGDPEREEVWQVLDNALLRHYRFKNGHKLQISACCIDSGYLTDMVYKFTTPRESRRVAAIKGRSGDGIPIINNPSSRNRTNTKVMIVGVDAAKAVIYSRLNNHDPGHSYIYFPSDLAHGCGDEYYQQLNSERRVLDVKRGIKRYIWKKIRPRNEALDTFVYALAAYEMAAPNLDKIKEWLQDGSQFETEMIDYEDNIISEGINLYG